MASIAFIFGLLLLLAIPTSAGPLLGSACFIACHAACMAAIAAGTVFFPPVVWLQFPQEVVVMVLVWQFALHLLPFLLHFDLLILSHENNMGRINHPAILPCSISTTSTIHSNSEHDLNLDLTSQNQDIESHKELEWRRDGALIFNAYGQEAGHSTPHFQG
uniref:Uncharacterized protein n=1 Tax=Ditylenchus dipsaci TaxID=166011 RepID=A0A915EGL7_9BILA